jgi:3-isopropylmalate dehydrogenase
VERIIRAAFEWAKANGKKRVAMADKSNAIGAHELWGRTFKEVAAGYPEIAPKHYYVDAIAMQMVVRPEDFDVIVTTNLFGDILTDLGAALTGGMGISPSASLNPDSTPLFEPVHGSAPDIAGKGIANPYALIESTRMMFEWLGHSRGNERAVRMAAAMSRATTAALADSKARTGDIRGSGNTASFTQAVLRGLSD